MTLQTERASGVLEAPPPIPLKMSWEEFLNWDTEVYAEWVDGEIMLLNTPSTQHQQLSGFLTTLMTLYAATRGLGTVLSAPYPVRLEHSARHPDILFVATAHQDRLQSRYMEGAPDLIVEIASESTRSVDEQEKYREYEAAGVREYWQLDQGQQRANFYRLGENVRYQPVPITEGFFQREVLPGFRLHLDWLWEEPQSHLLEALRELGVA